VPGTAEHGQDAGHERGQDRDVLRVAAQELLGAHQHHLKATGGLQGGRGGHHGNDGEHYVHRRLARGQLENEGQDDEAYAPQQPERHATFAGAVKQADQNEGDL
jgi:hypothetical protein